MMRFQIRPLMLLGVTVGVGLMVPAYLAADDAAPATAPASQPGPAVLTLHIAKQAPPASPYVTDQQIGDAIDKGAAFLKGEFAGGKLKDYNPAGKASGTGGDALGVYALLQCGLASKTDPDLDISSKYMTGLLDMMNSLGVSAAVNTYSRGIRLTCDEVAGRKQDQPAIKLDAESLLDSCHQGGWSYGISQAMVDSHLKKAYLTTPGGFDNSNSQYGALGIWSAGEAGLELPDDIYEIIEKHWTKGQCANGQWTYTVGGEGPPPTGAYNMTCAGIASLFVCHDVLDVAHFGDKVGREPFSEPLAKGLAWFEEGKNSVAPYMNGYTVYGQERVGLASGFKYFGDHDWYRETATRLIAAQGADGSWGSDGVDKNGNKDDGLSRKNIQTAYALLFLSRGRHPILMNKLRFDHYWANRPRDVAHLTRYVGKELERTFNWQVVTTKHDWSDWLDSSILYIASHEAPKLSDADFAKIRGYVDGGGMLFTQADGNSPAFSEWVHKVLVPKVFPDYELAKVPPTHDLYTVQMQTKAKTPLEMISNGSRVLMVHSPTDLSMWWQQDASKSHADAFQTAINLFVYSAGRSDFSNRIASAYIPDPPAAAAGNIIKVARVKYPLPTWNPEPYAWKRFANYMGWETSVGIQTYETDMAALGNTPVDQMPVAVLTGTNAYAPTASELQALHTYVNNGGTLIVDACGGGSFNDSIQKIINGAFKEAKVKTYGAHSALYSASAPGMVALTDIKLRPFAVRTLGHHAPPLKVYSLGKGRVIYSELDLTTSLLGSKTFGIRGYEGETALPLVRNLVLWSVQGAPGAAPAQPQAESR